MLWILAVASLNGHITLYYFVSLKFILPRFTMELGVASTSRYVQTCACRRTFSQPAAFKNHQNSCATSKKALSNALDKAKAVSAAKKAKRLQALAANLHTNGRSLPEVLTGKGSFGNFGNEVCHIGCCCHTTNKSTPLVRTLGPLILAR